MGEGLELVVVAVLDEVDVLGREDVVVVDGCGGRVALLGGSGASLPLRESLLDFGDDAVGEGGVLVDGLLGLLASLSDLDVLEG